MIINPVAIHAHIKCSNLPVCTNLNLIACTPVEPILKLNCMYYSLHIL